jgi:hypothetical protein
VPPKRADDTPEIVSDALAFQEKRGEVTVQTNISFVGPKKAVRAEMRAELDKRSE